MICTPRLLMFVCLPLFAAQAGATIIVSTSSDHEGCGGPNAPACPPPPVSTFNGGLIANGDFGDGNFTGYFGTLTQLKDIDQAGIKGNANQSYSFAYLGAAGTDQTLSQTIATTPGTTYLISFVLDNFNQGVDGSQAYDFNAAFGDQVLLSFTNPQYADLNSTTFTYKAVASSSSTTLSFTTRNDPGAFDLTDISVFASTPAVRTDITVAPTPEPSSLVLLGTGCLGLIGAARRKLRRTR